MTKNNKQNKITSNWMKKLLSYILILVSLVGFLSPIVKINAADDLFGSCIIRDSKTLSFISNNQTLSTDCVAGASQHKEWFPNAGMPRGTCVRGGQTYSNFTSAACVSSGEFQWTPAPTNTLPPTGSSTSGNPNDMGICTFNQTVTYDQCYTWNVNGWEGSNRSSGIDNKSGVCTVRGWSRKSCTTDRTSAGLPQGIFSLVTAATPIDTSYHLLAPLPCQAGDAGCTNGQLTTFDPTQANNLGGYLNLMIKIFIGICAVLAVIMIVMGGIEWMTSELPGNKEHGKERIVGAVFGLILALGAWTLIYTINPNILNTDLSSLQTASVTVGLTQQQQIANFTGSGKCTPYTPTSKNTSTDCTAANLAKWGFAGDPTGTHASSICMGESGGSATQKSGTDLDKDGNAFSFGLFQINAVANAKNIPACQGAFATDGKGSQGSCLYRDPKTNFCMKYNAWIIDQQKYQTCQDYLLNPTNNIAFASNLYSQTDSWNAWGAYNSCKSQF